MSEFHLNCGSAGSDVLLSVSPLESLANASASCMTVVKFKLPKGILREVKAIVSFKQRISLL
jgi:hypothetical protein